jgi:hypothetical protein
MGISEKSRTGGGGDRLNYQRGTAPQIYSYLARQTYVKFRGRLTVQYQK